jgi:toxin ParE1/3/4
MSGYRLSRRADQDLIDIYLYTLDRFCLSQAENYVRGITDCFEMLSGNPHIGRLADNIRKNLRRHEHDSHVIFYRDDGEAVLILAVLHRNMHADLQFGTSAIKRE